MVRLGVTGHALAAFREGYVSGKWSAAQLEKFQGLFEQLELLSSLTTSVQGGERASIHYLVENCGTDELLRVFSPSGNEDRIPMLLRRLGPDGWKYQALMVYDKPMANFMRSFDPVQQRIDQAGIAQSIQEVEIACGDLRFGYLAGMAVPNLAKASCMAACHQTMANISIIACALERYKRQNGSYPATLDGLAPQFLQSLPHELATGKPLTYSVAAGGKFKIYSAGIDGVSHGGTPGLDSLHGDWVWVN